MSKLSEKLQKLKDRRRTSSPSSNSSSPSRGFPSFRFTTADEEITEILDDIDADTAEEEDSKLRIEFKDEDESLDEPELHVDPTSSSSTSASPAIRRRDILRNKFSNFKSGSSINNGDIEPTEGNEDKSEGGKSWIRAVKGKLEEKYTEYKNEKEMRKLKDEFEDISEEDSPDNDKLLELPHSFSEDSIAAKEPTDGEMAFGRRSSTPVTTEEIQSNPQTPKEKRRFTFGFLNKTPSNQSQTSETGVPETPPKTSTNNDITTTSTPKVSTGATTPTKSSLRSRMMEKFMGKSPNAQSTPIAIDGGQNETKLKESIDNSCSPKEDFFGSPNADISTSVPETLDQTEHMDSDIEPGIEAHEYEFEQNNESDTLTGSQVVQDQVVHQVLEPTPVQVQNYWWSLGVPICLLLFLQLLPIPAWIMGFVTATLVIGPASSYATYCFLDDNTPRTAFVDNINKKRDVKPAIIVQEELKRIHTWMNLWPIKRGPYDPLTYDVRRTISVRIMLHGPWLEMRFPKRNMPLRRMHDDTEPQNVQFHEHVEVIDLSTCSIDIQPENLPTKRIWSKKYPIRIRTNTRKPYSTQEATDQMQAATLTSTPQAASVDSSVAKMIRKMSDLSEDVLELEEEEDVMLDAKDTIDDLELEQEGCDDLEMMQNNNETIFDKSGILSNAEDENKVFYLFTRTAREKEEWFNHLLVAAQFMEDWERQNPKEGSPVDQEYETQKVREQKFKIFMEDYPQAKNSQEAYKRHEEMKSNPELYACAKDQMAFVNVFLGRMWHDLHSNKDFTEFLREKITRKLLKVKISQYFEDVKVTTLDLGPKLPQILSVSTPWQDDLGLWVDVDLEYTSICQATVQTQGIRLPAKDEPDREAAELLSRQAAVLDSDEEDSAEVLNNSWMQNHNRYLSSRSRTLSGSSLLKEDDDVLPDVQSMEDANGGSGSTPNTPGELPPLPGFKARLVEGILRSETVAKLAQSEWVKKNITSTNITLQLQLHSIKGTLRVNFPPAPSDRIWYGFREPPKLDLALRPCFGGHSLGKYEGTISTVMKHLVRRLEIEFIKVLVCPNMDDQLFPFLHHVPYALTGNNPSLQPTSLYVPKLKPSQSLQTFVRN